MLITISERSRELINEYKKVAGLEQKTFASIDASMDLNSLLSWMKETPHDSIKSPQSIQFILISLRAELLHDLYCTLAGDEAQKAEAVKNISSTDSWKYIVLTFSGVLLAACQGFDSIVTIMGIFPLPSAIILASGLLFSFFSIIAFCGFDLVKLSNNFGVKLGDAHKLLDAYCQQLKQLKHVRKAIDGCILSDLSLSQLEEFEQIVLMLENNFNQLATASKQLDTVFHNKQTEFIKSLLFAVSSALFFGGAFCSGQTVSLYILGLFFTALTPASIPVVIFSLLVGFAALSLYWYVEFPGLKTLVDNWFGLSEEKISILCNTEHLDIQKGKITRLKQKINRAAACKSKEESEHTSINASALPAVSKIVPASTNRHSFLVGQPLPERVRTSWESPDVTYVRSL